MIIGRIAQRQNFPNATERAKPSFPANDAAPPKPNQSFFKMLVKMLLKDWIRLVVIMMLGPSWDKASSRQTPRLLRTPVPEDGP